MTTATATTTITDPIWKLPVKLLLKEPHKFLTDFLSRAAYLPTVCVKGHSKKI